MIPFLRLAVTRSARSYAARLPETFIVSILVLLIPRRKIDFHYASGRQGPDISLSVKRVSSAAP